MEIVAIVAFLLAILAGFKLMDYAEIAISHFVEINYQLLSVIAFVVVFILTVMVVNYIGKIVKNTLDLTPLGAVDTCTYFKVQ